MLQIMDKYPMGRFMISGGLAMMLILFYSFFFAERVENLVGESIALYLDLIVIGVFVIIIGFFNDAFKARITVPMGLIGWLISFIMLFIYSSNQSYE